MHAGSIGINYTFSVKNEKRKNGSVKSAGSAGGRNEDNKEITAERPNFETPRFTLICNIVTSRWKS
jgi:hypothetical protein